MSGKHHAKGGKRTVAAQAGAHVLKQHGPKAAKVVAAKSAQRHERKLKKTSTATTRYDRDTTIAKLVAFFIVVTIVSVKCSGDDGQTSPPNEQSNPRPAETLMCEDTAKPELGTFPCAAGTGARP